MTPLPPGSIIGIMGGGQLGRMLALAAARLGYRVAIYAPGEDVVAADVAAYHVDADWSDQEALTEFAEDCDVVTFEWENVPAGAAARIAASGTLWPPASVLAVAQDRLAEKTCAQALGLATPAYAPVTDAASLAAAVAAIGCPAILKTAAEGYDGKGQARVDAPEQAAAAWDQIGRARAILEGRVNFLGEFSVLVARGQDGLIRTWDVPENRHSDGMLHQSRVPAPADWADQVAMATQQAEAIAHQLGYVGVMAVEFFATPAGPLFNEMAPRVHNSGHWTVEGAVTCQFENHIRAICGLPLGDTSTRATPIVMRNLIGDDAAQWLHLLRDPACKLHLYGKGDSRPARKMGHATWVGALPR